MSEDNSKNDAATEIRIGSASLAVHPQAVTVNGLQFRRDLPVTDCCCIILPTGRAAMGEDGRPFVYADVEAARADLATIEHHWLVFAKGLRAAKEKQSVPDFDAQARLSALVRTLDAKPPGSNPTSLWSVVAELVACGSTMASQIVVAAGCDPSKQVGKPVWLDKHYAVIPTCRDCDAILDDQDAELCDECAAEREEEKQDAVP